MQYFFPIISIEKAKEELINLGVSSVGARVMSEKMEVLPVKIKNLSPGEANIIKQEMLCSGADAAIEKGVAEGTNQNSSAILIGTMSHYRKFLKRLYCHEIHHFPAIRNQFEALLKRLTQTQKSIKKMEIMGILNITPDSFSDGNKSYKIEDALHNAKKLITAGATILDIGGESSRPGAKPVSLQDELLRVIPIIKNIRTFSNIPISIDTYKAVTAEKAIQAGADYINDIFSLRKDEKMIEVLRRYENVKVILMHMQGTPETMQDKPSYDNVVEEIISFFNERIAFCKKNGIDKSRIIIDPGIGFGKRHEDNLKILNKLASFHSLGCKILLGTSRKSFISKIYTSDPSQRLNGTLATTALAFQNKLDFVRVHDVKENRELLETLYSIMEV